MHPVPDAPPCADAPAALFAEGHLHVLERVDGAALRFRLRESGAIQFGTHHRILDPDAIPLPLRRAVRHVRERFDRAALRAAVDDPTDVTFVGVAPQGRSTPYDWSRTPPFLGVDVHSATEDRLRPPDAAAGIFERLGLVPLNAVRKEVRATDVDPETLAIPASNWYDGPAAGLLVRNKTGLRCVLRRPDAGTSDTAVTDRPAEEVARTWATQRRFERIVRELDDRGDPVTVDTVHEALLADVARDEPQWFDRGDGDGRRAVRAELAATVREFLSERG